MKKKSISAHVHDEIIYVKKIIYPYLQVFFWKIIFVGEYLRHMVSVLPRTTGDFHIYATSFIWEELGGD